MPILYFYVASFHDKEILKGSYGATNSVQIGMPYNAHVTIVDNGTKGKSIIINGTTWTCPYVPAYQCYGTELRRTWKSLVNEDSITVFAERAYSSTTMDVSYDICDVFKKSSITFHKQPELIAGIVDE